MAFKLVNDLSTDAAVNIGGTDRKTGKKNENSVEGYYLGSETLTGGKYGPSVKHVFRTPKGNVGVWGRGNMGRQLEVVAPGTMTRLTFKGMKEIPGKNPMYNYQVEQDSENVIEASTGPGKGTLDNGAPNELEDYDTGYDDIEEAYEEPAKVVRAATKVRPSVQDLLKRK